MDTVNPWIIKGHVYVHLTLLDKTVKLDTVSIENDISNVPKRNSILIFWM